MAWGRKDNEADANEKTGQQLKAELDAANLEITRLKGLETELATNKSTLQTQQSELTELKQSMATLQQSVRKPAAETTQITGPESVLIDEDKAFSDRLSPLMTATMQNAARLAKMAFEQEITRDGRDRFIFNKYQSEFQEMLKQLSPVQLTMEQAYMNCFKIVKANHTNEILDAVSKGTNFFTESSGGTPAAEVKKDDTLTAEESAMAKKFGITDKDYLESKKQIQFVGA